MVSSLEADNLDHHYYLVVFATQVFFNDNS
jgi:hypothetical protein